ncbi:MAG: serine/threonine protein kinase, partial [Planctomycetota bacterium]
MPISVTCGACKKQFNVPDHYAGKTGKCTQCGAPILAPATTPAAAPKPASDDQLKASSPASDKVGVGSTLSGYKLQKRLGGDRSSVFLAQGPDGAVAMKVLPREVTQQSPTAAKRFLREARSLFGMTHANVATCLDAGEELGTLFLVMELFGGRTVRELMAERAGKVPTAEALRIGLHVARGLQHLNAQKLVHRNIMPDHILVGPDGTAKIVGLGLVKGEESEQAVTMRGIAVGTPQYMAPELAAGAQDVDTRCDLWALGITLYEMLAGEVPWFHK